MKKEKRKLLGYLILMAMLIIMVIVMRHKEKPVFEEMKLVALTYDDGPSTLTTEKLIEILEKYNASATFFVNGNHATANKKLVKKIVESGNEIGNHTLDHVWLTKLNDEEKIRQINGNENLLRFLSGQAGPMLVRPPYGDINQSVLDLFDQPFIMWSVDSRDWEVKDAAAIQNNVFSQIQDGDIIIMHDGYSSTIQGSEDVLKRLNAEGFQVVSVSRLFELKNKEIPAHQKVNHCR